MLSRYLIGWKKIKYNKIANSGMGITILKSELTDEYTEGYTPVYSATKEDKYFGYLENPKLLLQKDDLIIPARGNSIGHVKIAHEIVSTTQTTIYSRINQEIAFPKFIYYVSLGMKDIWFDFTNTAIPQITVNQINNNELYLPTMIKQKKICKILDGKIGNINDIIFLTKCSIEELKKYKQSLITEVVTKGLDKNVEMKDSGIEWIGEIPKDWEVVKTKYRYKSSKGLTITKDNLQEEGIPVLNYGEIHSKYPVRFNPLLNPVKFVSEDYIVNKNALLKYGDLIFADTSEDIEGSGNFTCFLGEGLCFAGYHTVVLKPTLPMNPIFMSYLFDSLTFRKQVRNLVQGIKVYSITQNILRNTYIWLPPLEEQDKIAKYLESKIKFIDNLVNEKQKVIKEYESYKKSLIYEYVTGKKEVGVEVE